MTRHSIILFIGIIAIFILFGCRTIEQLPQSLPSALPDPSATATLIPPTPTISPTPTLTPTQTPIPALRIDSGDQRRFYGDWEGSFQEYQTAYQASEDAEVKSAALLGIGRTYCLAEKYTEGVDTLTALIGGYPDSAHIPAAQFTLATCLESLGRHSEAADAYLNYMILKPGVIDSYILDRRGDALRLAGRTGEALNDYRAALGAPGFQDQLTIEIKIAQTHAAVGDYATALGIYQDVYNRTASDYVRAQLDLLMGQAYTALGQMEQAYAVYQDAVNNFPRSYDSYSALLALVEAGIPVDELNRGLVDYFAGQYGVALAAFERYIQAGGIDTGAAYYYTGLSYRALGNYSEAIAVWDRVIRDYGDNRYWDEAWEQKGYTQWFYLNDYTGAIQTLRSFASTSPGHPRAAEFIFDAALVAEQDDQLNLSVEYWELMAAQYPGDERYKRAIFLAGLTRYRLGDFAGAFGDFQKLLESAEGLQDRTAAYLWMGKSRQAQGDPASANAAWELAAGLDPTGYYSERARDLLQQRLPFTPPEQYDLATDPASERLEAENWLRTTFRLAPEVDLSAPGPFSADPRFQRGAELWELGLYEEARAEFEDLRLSLLDSPADNYRLANYFLSIGSYRQAILASRQVLNLAGMGDAATLGAPVYFNHIRFGTYFADLVNPTAVEYGFHPLFLYSVIRQESAFEGFVRSSAGARGLMQIIPATGEEIAREMNWPPDYSSSDLYRPQISVRMGADYLAKWRDHFYNAEEKSGTYLYAALAAYNGGPGNAIKWKQLSGDDPDLFLELIRFEETRNYIRGIYEIFTIYRRIYIRTP